MAWGRLPFVIDTLVLSRLAGDLPTAIGQLEAGV